MNRRILISSFNLIVSLVDVVVDSCYLLYFTLYTITGTVSLLSLISSATPTSNNRTAGQ